MLHMDMFAQIEQIKHWLSRGPFTFFTFLVATVVRQVVFSWLQSETTPLDATKSYTVDF